MRAAFTLVELLTVVAIMAIIMAMSLSVDRGDRRAVAVEAAARDLAGTIRLARSLAIERRTRYAVVFNIANAPGTSGLVLNNWSGGHWYQIMGTADYSHTRSTMGGGHPEPFFSLNNYHLTTFLWQTVNSWYGERKVLPARKVRFLALSDQDNGHVHSHSGNVAFPATYPRPWCGWWDAQTQRLRPWGGYDAARVGGLPVLRTSSNRNCSGFNYEGLTGVITGCSNPAATRLSNPGGLTLLPGGASRPLVNGEWMDSYISCLPDGTISFQLFGLARVGSYNNRGNNAGGMATGEGDIGDMAPAGVNASADSDQPMHFHRRTGWWYITLAPDAEADSDVFPSALAAQRSLMPAFRVAVSSLGDVRVVPVKAKLPAGASLDSAWIAPTDWTNAAITSPSSGLGKFRYNMMTNLDGSWRGLPVSDAITTEMLSQRCWFLAP